MQLGRAEIISAKKTALKASPPDLSLRKIRDRRVRDPVVADERLEEPRGARDLRELLVAVGPAKIPNACAILAVRVDVKVRV